MIYLLFAITCSVFVSILFKLFKRYSVDPQQAIIFNYPFAAFLSLVFLKPDLGSSPLVNDWLLFIILALLLISIFFFISKSIYTSGIVLTAIAQRLSLIIPVIAAFLIFGEQITWLKALGLIIGFAAIYASRPSVKENRKYINIWYPLIVFTGTGIIDVLFNQLTKNPLIGFTASLFYIFLLASAAGFVWLVLRWFLQKNKPGLKGLGGGILLGIFNFGSIYCYIKALSMESNRPSVVFSALDIGVIALGALVGIFLFKEKLSKLNRMSIGLAMIAIAILTFS